MNRVFKGLGISLAVLTLGIFNPVLAAQWVYLGDSQDNHSHYIDFDSLKGTGNIRTFWARNDRPYGQTESLTKWQVDCSQRQIGVTEAIEYNFNGSVSNHRIIDSNTGGMWEFAPGTIAEGYYDFVCSRITRQPQPEIRAAVNEYPKAACGDPAPYTEGRHQLYPVFVDYSPETLRYINNNLCRDAFKTRRQDGRLSIQVASFTTRSNAEEFANFVQEQLGNSEVGNPTNFVIR
ncbi:surface-adhesin E family protein [Cyanothece sp. BG0011]|uniref:surface-adhesin E family protein n=1 Tax=Cyanothece sp. BG0011 TaxID=2082950 RepID=UPI000D1DA37E|nr:surface-adhesin E family protein [Cyanothece sp. BG0011]